jgi:hypothetical protein
VPSPRAHLPPQELQHPLQSFVPLALDEVGGLVQKPIWVLTTSQCALPRTIPRQTVQYNIRKW